MLAPREIERVPTDRWRFADFEFDADSGELWRRDASVEEDAVQRLPPQPARLLAMLVERGGDLVGRDEIRDRLWPESQVDVDTNLHFCVRQIRAALGDSATAPRYIETLPRRGYRLIPPVERMTDGPSHRDAPADDLDETADAPDSDDDSRAAPLRRRMLALIAVFAVGAVAVAVSLWPPGGMSRPEQPLRVGIMTFRPVGTAEAYGPIGTIAEWILEDLDARGGEGVELVGPTTTAAYEDGDGLRELHRDYRLDYVVNGRFLDDEHGPRMLGELIRTSDGAHVWVEVYRDLSDGRHIGHEISAAVAGELGLGEPPRDPGDRSRTRRCFACEFDPASGAS